MTFRVFFFPLPQHPTVFCVSCIFIRFIQPSASLRDSDPPDENSARRVRGDPSHLRTCTRTLHYAGEIIIFLNKSRPASSRPHLIKRRQTHGGACESVDLHIFRSCRGPSSWKTGDKQWALVVPIHRPEEREAAKN